MSAPPNSHRRRSVVASLSIATSYGRVSEQQLPLRLWWGSLAVLPSLADERLSSVVQPDFFPENYPTKLSSTTHHPHHSSLPTPSLIMRVDRLLHTPYLLALVCALAVIISPPNTAAVHPKLKNLVSSDGATSDLLGSHNEVDQFYRIRRQQPRPRPTPRPGQQQGRLDLISLLDALNNNARSLENKLMRHENREVQVADFTSKTLNSLTADHSQMTASVAQIGRQLAAVEERVMAVLTLVATSDERQREMISKLGEGLDRLLLASTEPALGRSPNALPELPPGMALTIQGASTIGTDVKNIMRKMSEMEGNQDSRISGVSSEVRQLNEALSQHMGHVTSRQDGILAAVQQCNVADNEVTTTTDDSTSCQTLETQLVGRLELMSQMQQNQNRMLQDLKENTATAMGQQQAGLHALLTEIRQEGSYFNGSFSSILEGLHGLEEASRVNLGTLHSNLKEIMEESGTLVKQSIETMEQTVKEGHTNIMGAIDDAASMTDNLQNTVSDNYDLLSKEISGLNKVEQVMINTADAVLDTKRSIEFGIQQIILELSDIVSQSGKNINSTLSDQINNISFNILKNQTTALTNMTLRMEGEIAQVWRQIGIMYQQVEQSIGMLNNLQDTTDQHMNVSLSRVGNMDGTVGEINGKVADVEDNLNFLLSRLSLVTSEFNHMKAGVKEELDRLRDMAQEITIPNEDPDSLKYNINRKRHIPDGHEYK